MDRAAWGAALALMTASASALAQGEDARALLDRGANAQAAAAAERELAEKPDDFGALIVLALARFRSGEHAAAAAAFDRALAAAPRGADVETLRFNAASAYFEAGNFTEAEKRYAELARLGDVGAVINAGWAALRDGRDGDARRYAAQARALVTDDDAKTKLARLEEALRDDGDAPTAAAPRTGSHDPDTPRRAVAPRDDGSGFGLWFSVGGGWDSNAGQSGTAGTQDLTVSGAEQASAVGAASLEISWQTPRREATSFRLHYFFDELALAAEPVRDLSLQEHELGASLTVRFGPVVRLRPRVTSTLSLAGLDELDPFVWDNTGAVGLFLDTSDSATTGLEVAARHTAAFDPNDYLEGVRFEGVLSQRLDGDDAGLRARARIRVNDIGTQEIDLSDQSLPACDVRCDGATYFVPLSYTAPAFLLDAAVYAAEPFTFSVNGGVERRWYSEESFAETALGARVTASVEKRADTRVAAGASVAWSLSDVLSLVGTYDFLKSFSNVANDGSDPDEIWDYDNRNFDQHVVLVALEAEL